jgi:FG-GAP-like repeat
MRMLVTLLLVPGCSTVLGISDPVATGDGGAGDGGDGSGDGGAIDAPPPCIAPPAFAAPDSYTLPGTPGSLAVGNFTADNLRDVAIAVGTDVVILPGDGQGKLGTAIALGTAADSVLGDDFDANATDDLILWTVGGASVVARRQDAAARGTFLAAQPLPGPFTGVRRVVRGFLDGAFVPDLITQDDAERRVYTSLLGTPGTFRKEGAVGAAGDQVLAVANLIGTDNDDVALVTAAGGVAIASQISGGFAAPVQIASGATGLGAGFGQLDDDGAGALDLIVATPAGGAVYRRTSDAAPTFARVPGTVAGVTGQVLQIADVDGNGRADIVVAAGIVQQCAAGEFSAPVALPTTAATVFRDLDRNGKPEMLRITGNVLEVRVQ